MFEERISYERHKVVQDGWYIYGIIKLSERESNVLQRLLNCSGQKGTQAILGTYCGLALAVLLLRYE